MNKSKYILNNLIFWEIVQTFSDYRLVAWDDMYPIAYDMLSHMVLVISLYENFSGTNDIFDPLCTCCIELCLITKIFGCFVKLIFVLLFFNNFALKKAVSLFFYTAYLGRFASNLCWKLYSNWNLRNNSNAC
jgi:hypothetical protein